MDGLLRSAAETQTRSTDSLFTRLQAAVGSAGAMLAFSRAFYDDKERELQEAGARFAGTGAHPAFKCPVVVT